MAYIPKSQVKENQFTSGEEWYYVKNNKSYTGYYYELASGKVFTGRNQNDPPNEEITKIEYITPTPQSGPQSDRVVEYADNWDGYTYGNNFQNAQDIAIYGILTNTNYNLYKSIPSYSPTFPTPEDYTRGQYIRYFVVKINQTIYTEVNQDTYDAINTQNKAWVWENYIPFTLDWYIKGNIDTIFNNNKGSIFLKEKEINKKGLENYLEKQYLQYFEYPEAINLTTNGGELITPIGEDYIGAYHIHKNQGPMEGAVHIQGNYDMKIHSHRKLFYKRFYRGEIVNSLNQEGVIETGETQRIEFANDLTIEPDIQTPSTQMGGGSSSGGGY